MQREAYWFISSFFVLATAYVVWLHHIKPVVTVKSASETQAAISLESISTAEDNFERTHNGCWASSLDELQGVKRAPTGYVFKYSVNYRNDRGCVVSYSVSAVPRVPGQTGDLYYYLDEQGAHLERGKPATAASETF